MLSRVCVFSAFTLAFGAFQSWAQAPASSEAPAPASTLQVPAGTAFMAKLSTSLDISQAKLNDAVEAQITQDLKQGHDMLLKKGSTLLGHVVSAQPPTADKPQYFVLLAFDRVKPKSGPDVGLNLIIQALAPESDMEDSSLAEGTGTGLEGATRTAGVTGHSSSSHGNINHLTLTSSGAIDIRYLQLGEKISGSQHYTVLAASVKDINLKKGTQLVMKVVSQ